jgi:hypothetical protein
VSKVEIEQKKESKKVRFDVNMDDDQFYKSQMTQIRDHQANKQKKKNQVVYIIYHSGC